MIERSRLYAASVVWLMLRMLAASPAPPLPPPATITSVYPSRGSNFGGTYLVIDGTGFLYPAQMNPWDQQSVFVGTIPCKIVPHYSSASRIVCKTGSNLQFHGNKYFADYPNFPVSVQIFAGVGGAQNVNKQDAFNYRADNSPRIDWMHNKAGTGGALFKFNVECTPNINTAGMVAVRLGDTLCHTDQDRWPIQQLGSNRISMTCQLPDTELLPGYYPVNMRVNTHTLNDPDGQCSNQLCFPENPTSAQQVTGLGDGLLVDRSEAAYNHTNSFAGMLDLESGQQYHFTVYPEIHSIWPTQGGTEGGNTLTIYGRAFASIPAANTVTVGGAPCAVTAASDQQVECTLPAGSAANSNPKPRLRGLRLRSYASTATLQSWSSASDSAGHTNERVWADQVGMLDFAATQAKSEWTGFFVPPLTATYTFYIAGCKEAAVQLGTNLTTGSLQTIAFTYKTVEGNVYNDRSNPAAWWYNTNAGTGATALATQRSAPIPLIAGRSYPFAMQHVWPSPSPHRRRHRWMRLGLKIGSLSTAKFANGSSLSSTMAATFARDQPAMQTNMVRLYSPNGVKRERWKIEISKTNPSICSPAQAPQIFFLAVSNFNNDVISVGFSTTESHHDMKNKIKDAQVPNFGSSPTYILPGRGSLKVVSNQDLSDKRIIILETDAALPPGMGHWMDLQREARSTQPGYQCVTVTKEQTATAGIAGNFRLGHNNIWSPPISVTECDIAKIARGLSGIWAPPQQTQSPVEAAAWPSGYNFACKEDFKVFVQIRKPIGNVALQIDTTNIQSSPDLVLEAFAVEDGDADAIMLERVPATYFEMPDAPATPNTYGVTLVSHGFRATSRDVASPTYTYSSAMTLGVNSVSPAEVLPFTALTIQLSNVANTGPDWTQNFTVSLGQGAAMCVNITEAVGSTPSAPALQCSIAPGGTGGDHQLRIVESSQGLPNTAPLNVSHRSQLTAISPTVGSMAGGAPLALSGPGLRGLPCAMVRIDGSPCIEPTTLGLTTADFGLGDLHCAAPALNPLDACDGGTCPATKSKDIKIATPMANSANAQGSFSYASTSTAIVTDVSPRQYSAAKSTTLVFSGSGLSDGVNAPHVWVGARKCMVTVHNATDIQCHLLRVVTALPHPSTMLPKIWVPGKGSAIVPLAATFTSQFEVHSVSPQIGSYVGGTIITITGRYFDDIVASRNSVVIKLADGQSNDCTVLTGSATELRCRLDSGASAFSKSSRRLLSATDGFVADKADDLCRGIRSGDHVRAQCLARTILGAGALRSHAAAEHSSLHVLAELAKLPVTGTMLGAPRDATEVDAEEADDIHYRRLLGTKQAFTMNGTLSIKLNGITANCTASGGCGFEYSHVATHEVIEVSPLTGTYGANVNVKLVGIVQKTDVTVYFGTYACNISQEQVVSMSGQNATVFTVPLCVFPASTVSVYVLVKPYGYALKASPYGGSDYTFVQQLVLSSVSPPSGSLHGGTSITISGAGFNANKFDNVVTIGATGVCEVTHATPYELRCFTPDSATPGSAIVHVTVTDLGRKAGLKSEIFQFTQGQQLPSLSAQTAQKVAVDARVYFVESRGRSWPGTSWKTDICIRWSGQIQTSTAGIYTFEIESTDGSKLTIDGSVVVDNDGLHSMRKHTGAVYMFSGYHLVELLYFSKDDTHGMIWRYQGADTGYAMVVVPSTVLSHIDSSQGAQSSFQYLDASSSPQVTSHTQSGDVLTISGARFGIGNNTGSVGLGKATTPGVNLQCAVVSWSDTSIECTLPAARPAGQWQLRVWTVGRGWSSNAPTHLVFVINVQTAGMNGMVSTSGTLTTGFGGRDELELHGSGFGLRPGEIEITVCGQECKVYFSNGTVAKCQTPSRTTSSLLSAYPSAFARDADLSLQAVSYYTEQGASGSTLAEQAYRSQVDSPVVISSSKSNFWFAFDLSDQQVAMVYSVSFFPPTDPNRRDKASYAKWQVKTAKTDTTWKDIYNARDSIATGFTIAQGWNSFVLNSPVQAQSFRIIFSKTQSAGDVLRGVRFFGVVMDQGSDTCNVNVVKVDSALSLSAGTVPVAVPVQVVYSSARTPVLDSLTPNRGSARGGTPIRLLGDNLQPLDSSGTPLIGGSSLGGIRVELSGYSCTPTSSAANEVGCLTSARTKGMHVPSTSLWIAGKGLAIIKNASDTEMATFQFNDKWSDLSSWRDAEPPVDGDSVYVPQGQAILLDQNSPLLFLVLVSGWLEFDRKDLTFNATYIWVAGGHFQVGSEQQPFLNQATITLYGDRWFTIELPFIGSKMLAVTNLGGFHGGCHVGTTGGGTATNPCNVRSVGKIDLHGKQERSWTRLIQTVGVGDFLLRVAEPVNWPAGSKIIITQSNLGEAAEIAYVRSVEEDGRVVVLQSGLQREHLGIWYYHHSITPTDLRAAVGLLERNIVIQGDDSTEQYGNSFMFGAHIGAFHGGVMRIENVEFFRTGQAANMGRYSSHWHKLAGGRNVDVVDVAYLRNNVYHHTFQRAVVVHSTDFAVVKDNVAYKTRGHSFFTEIGDEDYALFEHNLAIEPLPHHLLLDDDMSPAGFWLPGFMGWHRSNMVAGAVRGWRVRKLSGAAAAATDLTFFNNTVHASGHGWHLFPPTAPPTQNFFKSFTAFRCGQGMFYYGTGNIFHDDHRFVECGSAHHQNFFFGGVHALPFFHNVILVGNIDNSATSSRVGLGLSGPKANEGWFTSGATVINFHQTPAFKHCWEEVCTARYERIRWYNSEKRTLNTPLISGIIHDMDGTLTGYRNGWVTWYEPFNHIPGVCATDPKHVNGIVCGDSTGNVRMRRLYVHGQQPWQLDHRKLNVQTPYGSSSIEFRTKKLYGWAVPVVSGHDYDIKIDRVNDFQKLTLEYSAYDYSVTMHGYQYTKCHPVQEGVLVHLNYSSWRDHFASWKSITNNLGTMALNRAPTRADKFGSYAVKLWADQCHPYFFGQTNNNNASAAAAGAGSTNKNATLYQLCDGSYHKAFGYDLKNFLDQQTSLPRTEGRLTTVMSASTINQTTNFWAPTYTRDTTKTPASSPGLVQKFHARETPCLDSQGTFGYTGSGNDIYGSRCNPPYLPGGNSGGGNAGNGCGVRRWSYCSGWPKGRCPRADEHVEIKGCETVILDVVTPIVYWVTVNGNLSFDRTIDTTLNCRALKVWGILEVGRDDAPVPNTVTATIALHGLIIDKTVIMVNGLFIENKVVAVLGTFTAVGTSKIGSNTPTWTKLSQTADASSTQLLVNGDVSSWPVGARIAIGPTEYPSPPTGTEAETRTITQCVLDGTRTRITIDSPLTYRHYGGVVASGTQAHWPKVELAAAVALLTQRASVVIKTGDNQQYHGGIVVVGSDAFARRMGVATIRYVDFEKMGQFDYEHPALEFKFLGAGANRQQNYPSVVENCIFSESKGGAITVYTGSDISIKSNTFHRTYRTALWLRKEVKPNAIKIERNLAIETLRHPQTSTTWYRPFAAFLMEVIPLTLRGNVASGSGDSGFVLRPQINDCTPGQQILHEADLNEAVGCMTGVFMLRSSFYQKGKCAFLRGFIVWKSSHIGITTADQNLNVLLEVGALADNHVGISLSFNARETGHRVYGNNLTILGSTPASTCSKSIDCRSLGPSGTAGFVGSACQSVVGSAFRRVGMLTYIHNNLPKLCEANPKLKVCRPPNTPVKECLMPYDIRVGSLGLPRYSEAHFSQVTFGYWDENDCGRRSVALTHNPTAKDFSFPHHFSGVKWLATAQTGARVYGRAFGAAQAGHDAVQQMAFIDEDGSFMSSSPGPGTILSGENPGLAMSSCTTHPNYFYCGAKYRVLKWVPLGDVENRVYGNMKLWRKSDGQASWSTGPFKPDCLPGDASHERAWQVRAGHDYNLTLFASPSKHHDMYYFNDVSSDKIHIGLFLTQPFRLEVYVDGNLLPEATYDLSQQLPARYPTLSDAHGSYAFDPHERRFYFTMAGGTFNGVKATYGGGKLHFKLLMVVQISLTLSVPVAQFDGSMKQTIIDNVATLLKIPKHRIKVVGVAGAVRRLQETRFRRLASTQSTVTVQIIEESTGTTPSTNVSTSGTGNSSNTSSNASSAYSWSASHAQAMSDLATQVQDLYTTGVLAQSISSATGVSATVNSITTALPPNIAVTTANTNSSTAATSNLVSVADDDDTTPLVVGIIVGTAFFAVLAAALIYYRFFSPKKAVRGSLNPHNAVSTAAEDWFIRYETGEIDGPFDNDKMRGWFIMERPSSSSLMADWRDVKAHTLVRFGDTHGEFLTVQTLFPDLQYAFAMRPDFESQQTHKKSREKSRGSYRNSLLQLALGAGRENNADFKTWKDKDNRQKRKSLFGNDPTRSFNKLEEMDNSIDHHQAAMLTAKEKSALVKVQACVRGWMVRKDLKERSLGAVLGGLARQPMQTGNSVKPGKPKSRAKAKVASKSSASSIKAKSSGGNSQASGQSKTKLKDEGVKAGTVIKSLQNIQGIAAKARDSPTRAASGSPARPKATLKKKKVGSATSTGSTVKSSSSPAINDTSAGSIEESVESY